MTKNRVVKETINQILSWQTFLNGAVFWPRLSRNRSHWPESLAFRIVVISLVLTIEPQLTPSSWAALDELDVPSQTAGASNMPADATTALRQTASMDSVTKATVYAGLRERKGFSPAEVTAIYDEMKKEGTHSQDVMLATNMRNLGGAISKASDVANFHVVAQLLAEEAGYLPRVYGGPSNAKTVGDARKEASQYYRLEGLLKASSDGHNDQARPILMQLSQRKDLAGELATEAIARMGDPSDLDAFIARLKKDSSFTVNLGPFGNAGLQRIVDEVHSSGLGGVQRNQILARLQDDYGHGSIAIYEPLLTDSDSEIRIQAAKGLSKIVRNGDSVVITKMLSSLDPQIRTTGIFAINNYAWSVNFVPNIISALKDDQNPSVRFAAATTLGNHTVSNASSVLQRATQDKSSIVREAAASALKKINGN